MCSSYDIISSLTIHSLNNVSIYMYYIMYMFVYTCGKLMILDIISRCVLVMISYLHSQNVKKKKKKKKKKKNLHVTSKIFFWIGLLLPTLLSHVMNVDSSTVIMLYYIL